MLDNDKITEMMGGQPKKKTQKKTETKTDDWESNLISGFKNKISQDANPSKTNTPVDINNPKISGKDIENIGNSFKNIPPFLLLGIVALVVPSFFPAWGFLRALGMLFIIIAIFGKIIPAENKHKAKIRLKALYAKWRLKQLEKQLEKENKKTE